MPARRYRDTSDAFWPLSRACEHCDGADSLLVRSDELRGLVCPICDAAIDAMLAEMDTPGDAYAD
jgi:hypothetical protein